MILSELLTDVLAAEDHKVIVWANFRTELNDIQTLLDKEKIKYVRIDGDNSNHIQKFAKEFQEDKLCRVYLGQIRTGIAVTLTAAKYMIYYSRSWMLDDWLQSRNRNYRIGQTQKTIVYRLIARDTVEEQQLHALDLRQDIAATITQKVDCIVCPKFKRCLQEDIKPWTKKCILDRSVSRSITKARTL